MLNSVILCLLFCFSFVFDGYIENLLIFLSTIIFYKHIIIDKKHKTLIKAMIVAILIANCISIGIFRENIKTTQPQPIEEYEDTIVLLISEGEDEDYNLPERANEIYQKSGYKSYLTGIKDLYQYKKYYSIFGSSTFKKESEYIAKNLRASLGDGYKVVNSYMYSSPYFENSLEDIIEFGYRNVIIVPMFMTEGKDYEIFKERYEDLTENTYDMNIRILDTMYKSNNLAKLYTEEILNSINGDNQDIGILLVGLKNKNNLEQDILFREKIKNYITQQKNNNDIQIKLPLLENNKNDIIKSGEELLEYGIDALYIALPTCTIDTMYTKYLVESILRDLDMGITKFYYINPEKKNDVIVEEILTKIKIMDQIGG